MPEAIITTLIGSLTTLVICLINNGYQAKKTRLDFQAHYEKTNALMEYKLDELTKQVQRHNSIVERTFGLEKAVSVIEERQSVANHRIDDLERMAEQGKK